MAKFNTAAAVRRPAVRDISACAFLFLAARASIMGLHPFGIAAFAACIDSGIAYIGLILICLGLITSASASYIIKYLTAALIFWLLSSFVRKRSPQFGSALCAASTLLGGALYTLCYFTVYTDLITCCIEGIVSGIMYIIFLRASGFISTSSARTSIAKDELISVALAAGVCVTGVSGVSFPLGISLDGIAAAYVIMCAAYNCSIASAGSAGLGIGFMCTMSSSGAIASTGFYGLCAMFGSLLKGFGKFGTAVGFLGGACAALIYSHFGTATGISAPDLVIGSIFFIATPERAHHRISELFTKSLRSEAQVNSERIRGFLSDRLKKTSEVFEELGTSFQQLSQARLQRYDLEAADLFEDTARAVCRGCTMAGVCWEREFPATYKRLVTLLENIEKDGSISKVPRSIAEKCIRSEAFVNEFVHIYNSCRQRELFKGEAVRARDIAAAQYTGFSEIISRLRTATENSLSFNSEIEELLITELDKRGIILFEISVIELGENKLEIYLGLSNGAYIDRLEKIIKEVTNKEVEFESESGGIVKFVSKPCCSVKTGMCSVPCEGCSISGDNIEIFDTEDHRSFVIISDGMGSGRDARNESEGIVRLLKDFVCAGYDAELAIRTVNSALCMQLDRERAATVDMLCIDRATGIAKLFKIGCAQSFFLHSGSVDVLFPMSLPAGMVDEIDLNPQTLRLHDGDVLAMVTDGITQSGNGEWIRAELDSETDAQELARRITDKALERWGGAAFDDMTCAVIKIKKGL